MTDIDRFGISDIGEVTFTEAPLRTKKELEDAREEVKRMEEMMGLTYGDEEKEAL